MRILGDDITLLETLARHGGHIHSVDPTHEGPEIQRVLAAIAPPDASWFEVAKETADDPALGPWILIRHAPRSHLDVLVELMSQGVRIPDGLAIMAAAGRFQGQRGRTWHAQPGNLQLVVHLEVNRPANEVQAGIAVLPAVAVADELTACGLPVGVKWVNDIVANDAKVGGVLTRSEIAGGELRSIQVGIGLNVAQRPFLAAEDTTSIAPIALAELDTSFAQGGAWSRLLSPILERIVNLRDVLRTEHETVLVDRYREHAVFLGRHVTIWPVEGDAAGSPQASGRVLELLPDLSLRIEGHEVPIRAGRMRW